MQRSSVVQSINLSLLGQSSILNIGELKYYRSIQNVLAYQREQELFLGNEGRLGSYKVFHTPSYFEPADEHVIMTTDHINPYLTVKHIKGQAISSTSLLHIGNGKLINAQTRLMNIRQLLR